jgi:hypothetical protein
VLVVAARASDRCEHVTFSLTARVAEPDIRKDNPPANPMAINWNNLRSWNGSQSHSFEELCCQLAAAESVPEGSRFFRKGTPDAAVECFWQLPNGDEWAWQAKFFRTSPGQGQWQQIDKSVKTALVKHPRLTKYTVCLPIDLSDQRRSGQRSALRKWQDWVAKWERLAATKGVSVSFEYWGQSEIGGRLSDEKHRGRHWFWFREESLSSSWFVNRVDEAVANARDRYTPDLNVDLPIRSYFDALGRTPAFFDRLEQVYSEARVKFKRLRPATEPTALKDKYDDIATIARQFFATIEPWLTLGRNYLEWSVTRPIPWTEIHALAERLSDAADQCTAALYGLKDARDKEGKKEVGTSSDDLDWKLHHLREFQYAVDAISAYSEQPECALSNRPALLLVGKAGQGKTHLLCEVAKRETGEGRPRLILHGEQFQNAEPWSQIGELNGLNCSTEGLLGALEAAAQANHCRVLIFIDALNEGEGNRLWRKFLPGMLTTLARSQWLGICVSVRSSYEKIIIPETLDQPRIVRVEHQGFGELAYDAAAKFFGHFGIEPSTPLLFPEFNNPLFLKLFCRSLHNAGLTRVPSGLRGLNAIFRFFIASIDTKLARPEGLDYDVREAVVERAVNDLADEMARRKTDRLPLDEAKSIVNAVLPRQRHQDSLFRNLESEGVLTTVPDYWKQNEEWSESVRFTYQRFSDHLMARRLLERHLDKNYPKKSFSQRHALGRLVKDERTCWMNRGMLEALAIQLPEFTKKELPDLVPRLAGSQPMREAFVEGIVWRDPASFSPATLRYIDKHVLTYRDTSDAFWDALILLSTTPHHPLNADRLHEVLSRFELAPRDAWWSVFLHNQWGERRAVDRLIEWAWREDDKSAFDDEVIRLAAVTLAWFFTTANRFLRDRATKAMVRLCENRIHVLGRVMEKFVNANDPYVSERLYAVAYGCAMRTSDTKTLSELARDVYRWVFESGESPAHDLLRDYARGVIECALRRGSIQGIDAAKIRPPYRSEWPSFEIPEPDELKPWGEWEKGMPDELWARVHLYDSVMKDEDFSRHVIGDLDEWSSQRIGQPPKPTHKQLHDQFVESLTERQREAWTLYDNVRENVDLYRRLEPNRRKEAFQHEYSDADLEAAMHQAEQNLVRTLGKKSNKYAIFRDVVKAYAAEPHKYYRENSFDGQLGRRWVMQRIINLGWTLERFGKFDRYVTRYGGMGREANKAERIGKKYQWIAYHELLARLSDNYRMREEKWSVQTSEFQGPWDYPFGRDIDPSNLLQGTPRDEWRPHTYAWWFPPRFESWDDPIGEVQWLKKGDDLPGARQLIEVTRPQDRSCWVTLDGYYRWQQPTPSGEETYEVKRRDLWYMLKGYLVRKADAEMLLEWAKGQSWMNRWMPESHESYSIFLGEFFWSPAFKAHDSDDYSREGWTRGPDDRVPVEILVAIDEYGWEGRGFDCSIDDSVFINLPCSFFADKMPLKWRGVEGEWHDKNGELAAFDPSVRSEGPSVMLFRRDAMIDFLDSQRLTLFWTLLGEKRTIGGQRYNEDYKGHLEINGAYILKNNALLGGTRSRYLGPGDRRV